MPMINNSISYSAKAKGKISELISQSYDHQIWGSPELGFIRREIRNFYRYEQRLVCAYCYEKISARSVSNATVEHILSKSAYPQFIFEPKNLCVVCADCNEYKRNREALVDPAIKGGIPRKYPENTSKYRLFHPHFDEYQQHIIKAGIIYIGKTSKGDYTISICSLNRFFHKFGVSQEFQDDLETLAKRESFHRS